jgi:hypothetical protein
LDGGIVTNNFIADLKDDRNLYLKVIWDTAATEEPLLYYNSAIDRSVKYPYNLSPPLP